MSEQTAYTKDDLNRIGRVWLDRIKKAEGRESDWIKDAEKAEAAYTCDTSNEQTNTTPDFNILHSNVETIVPAIINSPPLPDIRPTHNKEDPALKAVADIFERSLNTLIDDNKLDIEVESTAQDGELTGRGITRIKFDADEMEQEDEQGGITDVVVNERVLFENVSWRDYRFGPCKRFQDRPWECFRHEVSEDERSRLENPEITKAYTEAEAAEEDLDCTIWEIWCGETKKVYFISDVSGKVLDIKPDPLGLKGFFSVPSIIQPITATGKTTPTNPHKVYAKLADELDVATARINRIMKGLKVRGVIAGDASALDAIQTAEDNQLVAVGNIENLIAAGGLDKAVMWWPIDMAIAVLQQLYTQREQVKQTIYEVTGISDIVRGASDNRETATAQQIKTQWGSLRIRKRQTLLERHIRDLFTLSVEIMSKHFSLTTLEKLSGIKIDPQLQPTIEQALDLYRIDVETDSTIRADLTKSRGEMSEFLRGTSEFFASMAPVVQSAPASAEPLARMYAAFARQFNLGKDAEDALEQFVKMAQEAAAQAQAGQGQDDGAQAELQAKMQEMQARLELEAQKLQQDGEFKQADLAMRDADSQRRASVEAERLEIERQKLAADRDNKAMDRDLKAHEIKSREGKETGTVVNNGFNPEDLGEAMGQALGAISEQIQQSNQALLQGQQELAATMQASNQSIVQAMTAPKEVIRDETGRPVGVQTRVN